jgi:hypothetical protein
MQSGAQDQEFLPNALWIVTENSAQVELIMQMNENFQLMGGIASLGILLYIRLLWLVTLRSRIYTLLPW